MKKFSIAAAVTALALSTAAPAAAQNATVVDNDPFATTAGLALSPLLIAAGAAVVVFAVASSSGTD